MKYIPLVILIILSLSSLEVNAQKKERKKKIKPSSVCINEIFLHNDQNPFSYKREWHILEWVEIFNGTSRPIYLKDYFLTDDLHLLSKWPINPINGGYAWLKKKKTFPVYLHDRARRNGAHLPDAEIKGEYLYLTKNENGTLIIVDTLKLPANNIYPYSRYPDGGDFIITDHLTPGTQNLLSRESESKNTYGINFQLGEATEKSSEFPNASYPALAGGMGVYTRKNLGSFAMEYGMRGAIRGYRIDYSGPQTTSKGTWQNHSTGRQTIYYIDLPYFVSKGIFRNVSIFAGPMFSIRIKSSLKFKTDRVFTYDPPSTQPNVYQTINYNKHEGNAALDLLDVSLIIGLRYQLHNNFNFSLYYMNDVSGLNLGAGGVVATQTTKGVFFSVGKPLFSGKKRVKKISIF
jgi:hypothetical protein